MPFSTCCCIQMNCSNHHGRQQQNSHGLGGEGGYFGPDCVVTVDTAADVSLTPMDNSIRTSVACSIVASKLPRDGPFSTKFRCRGFVSTCEGTATTGVPTAAYASPLVGVFVLWASVTITEGKSQYWTGWNLCKTLDNSNNCISVN